MNKVQLETLEIRGEKHTFYTPHVLFNADTGHCLLEGESFLENTWGFYEQLRNWLEEYAKTEQPIVFDFKMIYFNTSSSKGILELLLFLKEYEDQGNTVQVNWYYPNEDEDILEEAEDFIEDTQLDIKLIPC
uniref:DUF1987 domain-containing protein n=1 Tax=Roseihalotalea indica TaxID=2867963 RepID=A0AA49JHM0_9BACT|nr:DUF1987 domain-containing protein [Tunicatimonas sp. TK19036]